MSKAVSMRDLQACLREASSKVDEPVNVIVTGRTAALVHGIPGPAPGALEVLPVDGLGPFVTAFDQAAANMGLGLKACVLAEDQSTGLPSTWRDRMRMSHDLSFGHVRVFLPAESDVSQSLG